MDIQGLRGVYAVCMIDHGERPIFGKIRYMSYQGCASKFSVKDYIDKVKLIKTSTDASDR